MTQRYHLIACAIAVLASGAASAQDATPDTWLTEGKSVLSRAAVQRELARARAGGEYAQLNAETVRLAAATTMRTRAEVLDELRQSRASGEYEKINAEAMLFAPALQHTNFFAVRGER